MTFYGFCILEMRRIDYYRYLWENTNVSHGGISERILSFFNRRNKKRDR